MPNIAIQQEESPQCHTVANTTRRVTVPALEEVLHQQFDVLDHGFVRVIDYLGDDTAVVQAARVSYGNGTKGIRSDQALLRYLMRHGHSTPFEMCEIKLHVKLPIFVARQWIRHRTAHINELSGRYSILAAEFYHPTHENICGSSTNRQGRGIPLSSDTAKRIEALLKENTELSYDLYRHLVDDDALSREVARIALPMSIYTQWYWKIDLHNMLHFLSLRLGENAQYEIRSYAEVIRDLIKLWVPLVYEAFRCYRLDSIYFSAQALKTIQRLLAGESVTQETSGLAKGEWREMMNLLYPSPR